MNRNSNGMSTGMALLCTIGILLFIGWIIDLGTPKCIKSGCDNDAKAVIATFMTIVVTDIRVALLTAEALRVQVVHHPRKVAVLLPVKRAVVQLQAVIKQIHPAAVLQRRITVLRIPMMMAIMQFMKMMIMIGIVTGVMMNMLPE